MKTSSERKAKQLGMPIGTASNRLRKNIMFSLLEKLDLNVCHQCGQHIYNVEELSIEHKVPWQDSENPVGLFFSLDNIAFSHLKCNVDSARHVPHGNAKMYLESGCRCVTCCNYAKKMGL